MTDTEKDARDFVRDGLAALANRPEPPHCESITVYTLVYERVPKTNKFEWLVDAHMCPIFFPNIQKASAYKVKKLRKHPNTRILVVPCEISPTMPEH